MARLLEIKVLVLSTRTNVMGIPRQQSFDLKTQEALDKFSLHEI